MNGLKSLIIGAAIGLPLTTFAEDYSCLTFRLADDSELSVAAKNLTINYNDRVLELKSATVSQEIPVDQIRTMRFTSSSSGLNDISDDVLSGTAEFYDISGIKVGSYKSVDDAREALPSGIYIVKNNNRSFKVVF